MAAGILLCGMMLFFKKQLILSFSEGFDTVLTVLHYDACLCGMSMQFSLSLSFLTTTNGNCMFKKAPYKRLVKDNLATVLSLNDVGA